MPRYIDADKLLNSLPDDLPYKASVKRVLIQAPTADVVPKSEVEKLRIEVEALKIANEKMYEAFKKQPMEIFAEIEQQLRGLFDFFRQDDCIRESSAIMLAISEIAELKNKYTESEGKE